MYVITNMQNNAEALLDDENYYDLGYMCRLLKSRIIFIVILNTEQKYWMFLAYFEYTSVLSEIISCIILMDSLIKLRK